MFRSPNFDKHLDDATDSFRLEVDWQIILKICDLIRQGDVKPSYALSAIQKKVSSPNSHSALYGLMVLESCVKNCGALIQNEISSKQFMETFKDIIKASTNEKFRTKGLDLLQSWAFAFRNIPKFRAVQDTVNIMKAEGYKFPVFKESDAMFSADNAPDWEDGDRCHRCRVAFTFTLRKHHCRACGQVFCQQCSSHTSTLPKFGIEKPVRVCETCFEKYKHSSHYNEVALTYKALQKAKRKPHKSRKSSPSWSKTILKPGVAKLEKVDPLPIEYLQNPYYQEDTRMPPKKSEEELQEDEELQLALALSQSEAESKRSTYRPVIRSKSFSPPVSHQKMNQYDTEDPELTRYLNRSYWETRASSNDRSSDREEKLVSSTSQNDDLIRDKSSEENGIESDDEIEEFVSALRSQVEIFVNRMKSNSSRGRSISNDTSVQSLFLNITAMHSKLLKYIQQQDDKRVYYEGLQDKITQVKDARAALDALREEHRERLRREAEIAERQRQLQMAQKLEIMRQKKQEYLQYQRQLALQRIHDQERELHMRQEQQKQQYRLGSAYGSLPYIPPAQGGAVSAFEPVASMGMNMNSLPPVTVSTGQYVPPSCFPTHYTQGQTVPPQQQVPPSQVIMGQSQMPPNSYVPAPVNQANTPAHTQQIVSGQQPTQQYPGPQQVMHQANTRVGPPSQPMYSDHQNPHAMQHMDQNMHVMKMGDQNTHMMPPQPSHPQQISAGMSIQHSPMSRPMVGTSSSPLSSPSSSSEHSLIQHGSQPVPSAPSATSTPQPEEKEDVAELISFD